MRCSDITSVALRLTLIPLLYFLISTKLECVYKNHYELFLLPHPQFELHHDLSLQMSLRQIPTDAKLLLLSGVHHASLDD